jgi:GT2 family glycosyltransferase
MTASVTLSVSIVSTNEKEYLLQLLPTLYKAAEGVSMEVIIIDNASEDNIESLKKDFPQIRIIRNSNRKSFARNHNLALKEACGIYFLLLNPDILFDENEACISKMTAFMEKNPDCGLAGCRVYNFNKEFAFPARRFQNISIALARRFPALFASEKILGSYLYKDHDIYSVFEPDWLSGCFLFTRREALLECQGLDERYPKYFEDVDLAKSMKQHNWKVLFNGASFYFHLEKRASKKLISKDAWYHFISWIRWIIKNRKYKSTYKQ